MRAVSWLTRVPGRWLIPLLTAALALGAALVNHALELGRVRTLVVQQETRVLRERLSIEQTRLDLLSGSGDAQQQRRLVGSLGLHPGLDHAFLLTPDGRVQASLSRLHIGRPFAELGGAWPPRLRELLGQLPAEPRGGMLLRALPETARLAAFVPIQDGGWLIASVDLSVPLAEQVALTRQQAWRDSAAMVGVAALLAWLLHLIWFRRARQIGRTLAAIGHGRLEARSGLAGHDELALIGAEIDEMAGQLQADQAEIRLLSDVVSRSPVVVIEWRNEPGWPVAYVNDAVAQWGYRKADWLAGRWDYGELIHPDDKARVYDEVTRYFAHGPDRYEQEYRLRCADGRWAWVDDRTSLRRGPDGTVLGITGVLVDISAQKAAQAAEQEQADLMRLFYGMPFIGIAIAAPDSPRWLQVNDRLCEILGRPREALLQANWVELVSEPDRQRGLDLFAALLAQRCDSYQMEQAFSRPDGRTVHTDIHVRAVREPDGRLRHLFTTVQDSTERLRASAERQEQMQRLEQAERMAGLGSWSFDPQGGRGWWSLQMYRNLGLDPADGVPDIQAFLALVHPQDRARVEGLVQALCAGEPVPDADFRSDPARGPLRWFHGTVLRHGRGEGQPPR
jgi:PAS domain S-box-containing protein